MSRNDAPGREALCNDLGRIARQRLGLRDVRRAVSLPSVLQHLLQRWRAELSCAAMLGDASLLDVNCNRDKVHDDHACINVDSNDVGDTMKKYLKYANYITHHEGDSSPNTAAAEGLFVAETLQHAFWTSYSGITGDLSQHGCGHHHRRPHVGTMNRGHLS